MAYPISFYFYFIFINHAKRKHLHTIERLWDHIFRDHILVDFVNTESTGTLLTSFTFHFLNVGRKGKAKAHIPPTHYPASEERSILRTSCYGGQVVQSACRVAKFGVLNVDNLVCLVDLVCLVFLICLVCLVYLVYLLREFHLNKSSISPSEKPNCLKIRKT